MEAFPSSKIRAGPVSLPGPLRQAEDLPHRGALVLMDKKGRRLTVLVMPSASGRPRGPVRLRKDSVVGFFWLVYFADGIQGISAGEVVFVKGKSKNL